MFVLLCMTAYICYVLDFFFFFFFTEQTQTGERERHREKVTVSQLMEVCSCLWLNAAKYTGVRGFEYLCSKRASTVAK